MSGHVCSGRCPPVGGRYTSATSPSCQTKRMDGALEDESRQRQRSSVWGFVTPEPSGMVHACLYRQTLLSWRSVRSRCSGCVCLGSWDDSSSVSSGISDTIDNLSTDDITSSSIGSYANTPASSRKSLDVQVRSRVPPKAPGSREPWACGPRGLFGVRRISRSVR